MLSNATDSAVTATTAAEERLKNAMSSSSSDATQNKRAKNLASNISKHLTCSITQELMVDPVFAADGHTYERKEITRWLASNNTSPKTNLQLENKTLFPNISAKQQIEELVASGELDDEVCAGYLERKEAVNLEQAQKLFDEGKVEEAAELGLPEAQGKMAQRCYWGCEGVAKDLEKCVEWAKKAAEGGDVLGQYRFGCAYYLGEGGLEKDDAMALKWFEKAAEQECPVSMFNIGNLYEYGGHGVTKNLVTAVSWYRDSAVAGLTRGQHNLGNCYYHGRGVTKNQETALNWFKKAANQGEVDAICDLGSMMVKGEGGAKRISEGCQWLEKAAAKGHKNAQVILDKMSNYEVHTQMINDLNSAQSELAAANRQLKETVEGLRKAEVKKLIPEGGVGAMKAADLRQALEKLGIETKPNGKNLSKKELVTALEAALKPSSDNSTAEGEEEEAEAEEITLADGTTVYYVEETGLCYSTNGEMEEIGSYNSETNSLEESKEGEDRPVITLADGTTVYYVEDTGLCYSTNGGIQPLGSYNSETNSLKELNLTP